jgi:hypothetical protein
MSSITVRLCLRQIDSCLNTLDNWWRTYSRDRKIGDTAQTTQDLLERRKIPGFTKTHTGLIIANISNCKATLRKTGVDFSQFWQIPLGKGLSRNASGLTLFGLPTPELRFNCWAVWEWSHRSRLQADWERGGLMGAEWLLYFRRPVSPDFRV